GSTWYLPSRLVSGRASLGFVWLCARKAARFFSWCSDRECCWPRSVWFSVCSLLSARPDWPAPSFMESTPATQQFSSALLSYSRRLHSPLVISRHDAL